MWGFWKCIGSLKQLVVSNEILESQLNKIIVSEFKVYDFVTNMGVLN